MKNTIIYIFLIAVLVSCTKEKQAAVEIRVKNETQSRITDVKVYASSADTEKTYGTIPENTSSGYIGYGEVYNTPLLSYSISGAGVIDISTIRCATPLPSLLPAGRYTLLISGDYASPDVFFIKD